jgi:hypothetical protein
MASFLMQQPSQTGRDLNTFFPRYRQWWVFAFASDKWQATPKMTVDLGLRWEFYPPATPAVAGGFSNYNPTNDTLVLAGIGGNPSNLGIQTRYKYFAPRTGFAYRLRPNTVLRGGFGISYTPFMDNTYAYNYPVRANNSYQPVGSAYSPAVLGDGVTVATFQAGFPAPVPIAIPTNGIITLPTSGTTLLAKQLIAQVYTYIPSTFKNPYADSWNVAVQQALPFDMSLQVAYVANHGTDMSVSQNINLPSTYGICQLRAHRGHQPILPRLLLELRVAASAIDKARLTRAHLYLRVHLGQGVGLFHWRRRRRNSHVLHQPAQKLCSGRLRPQIQL